MLAGKADIITHSINRLLTAAHNQQWWRTDDSHTPKQAALVLVNVPDYG